MLCVVGKETYGGLGGSHLSLHFMVYNLFALLSNLKMQKRWKKEKGKEITGEKKESH